MVHAARRVRPGAADRRPHRLRSERRLARRLPERHGRGGGAAPDRGGGNAAGDRAPRELGRRGGRALRALALRLVRRRRLDGRPGRAAREGRRRTASRFPMRSPRTASTSTVRSTRARSSRTPRPISSCTSSRAPCSSRWTSRSASCSGRSASSATRSRSAARPRTQARRRWTSAATRSPGAAKLELEIREIAKRTGGGAVCTMGGVVTKPGIVTSVVETAECLLDQRHLDAGTLASMLDEAKARVGADRRGGEHRGRVGADLEHRADPLRRALIELADEVDPRGLRHVAPPAERPAARRRGGRARRASRR